MNLLSLPISFPEKPRLATPPGSAGSVSKVVQTLRFAPLRVPSRLIVSPQLAIQLTKSRLRLFATACLRLTQTHRFTP